MKCRIPNGELPENTVISPFGNPCVFWDAMPDWDLDCEDEEELIIQDEETVEMKRSDLANLILHSTEYEDVFLRDYETKRCAGYWETIDEVPDCVIRYVEMAGVNPITESLILEVCSPIFDSLMKIPCVGDELKTIFDPNRDM